MTDRAIPASCSGCGADVLDYQIGPHDGRVAVEELPLEGVNSSHAVALFYPLHRCRIRILRSTETEELALAEQIEELRRWARAGQVGPIGDGPTSAPTVGHGRIDIAEASTLGSLSAIRAAVREVPDVIGVEAREVPGELAVAVEIDLVPGCGTSGRIAAIVRAKAAALEACPAPFQVVVLVRGEPPRPTAEVLEDMSRKVLEVSARPADRGELPPLVDPVILAAGKELDALGREVYCFRGGGEPDATYRERVRLRRDFERRVKELPRPGVERRAIPIGSDGTGRTHADKPISQEEIDAAQPLADFMAIADPGLSRKPSAGYLEARAVVEAASEEDRRAAVETLDRWPGTRRGEGPIVGLAESIGVDEHLPGKRQLGLGLPPTPPPPPPGGVIVDLGPPPKPKRTRKPSRGRK